MVGEKARRITIIQEPADADYPSMPLNVLNYVKVDHAITASDMGPLLKKLTTQRAGKKPFAMGIMNEDDLTPFTCPECHGVLVRLIEGKFIRFRCHTGHAYTASALLADLSKVSRDVVASHEGTGRNNLASEPDQ